MGAGMGGVFSDGRGQENIGQENQENIEEPSDMQMPENNQMSENSEEFSNNIPQSGSDGNIVMKVILVVISLVALLIGLIFVFTYKKY